MARQELTIYTIDLDGVNIGAGTNVLGANDGAFVNDGHTILKVVNGAGAERTFDCITPITVGGQALAVADHTVTIAASATRYVGPFPTGIYNQPSGADAGKVYFDLATDDLTFTAIRVP